MTCIFYWALRPAFLTPKRGSKGSGGHYFASLFWRIQVLRWSDQDREWITIDSGAGQALGQGLGQKKISPVYAGATSTIASNVA